MTQGPEETRIPERTAIDTPSAERSRTLTLGVVVERQPTGHRWQAWRFVPVAVQPGVVSDRPWRLLAEEDGVSRYLAASLTLELHRKEATDYRANLAGRTPVVYVVMRPEPGAVFAWRPAVVTVSPSRAEAAVEYGDDMVETVAMPPAVHAWVQAFVARHYVDAPAFKRRRKGRDKAPGEGSDFVRVDRRGDRGEADDA